MRPIPCLFHPKQLDFKPAYEWAFGKRLPHRETTRRAEAILGELKRNSDSFSLHQPTEIPLGALRATHSYKLLTLYNSAETLADEVTFYPSVYPKKEQVSGDPTNINHAGFYCFDSGTPLNSKTWSAAAWSAACAYDAARILSSGEEKLLYSLSRPPGHHASREIFGGYCYFNNAALAAKYLQKKGSVALLDIDFHHGNGSQDIFYSSDKVLTISVHGKPDQYFPYFSGYASETGSGSGAGYNMNLPLPTGTDGRAFVKALSRHIIPAIKKFSPTNLIISAGFGRL